MAEYLTDEYRVAVMRHYEAFQAAFGCRGQSSLMLERNGDVSLVWTEFDITGVTFRCKPSYFLDASPHDTTQHVAGLDLTQTGHRTRMLIH